MNPNVAEFITTETRRTLRRLEISSGIETSRDLIPGVVPDSWLKIKETLFFVIQTRNFLLFWQTFPSALYHENTKEGKHEIDLFCVFVLSRFRDSSASVAGESRAVPSATSVLCNWGVNDSLVRTGGQM